MVDLIAIVVACMPASWIATLHGTLNIGPFPSDAIAYYLARSSSMMYAVHGLLLLFLSCDILRYLQLIRFLAFLSILHGLMIAGIDLSLQMPWFWTALEGPLLIAWGLTITLLIRPK